MIPEHVKKEKKEKASQELYEVIDSLPNDPEYKPVPNMPIPLGKSVIVKRVKQNIVLAGGLILPETNAENSQTPKTGVIMAVGPDCTRGVRVGLRCYMNHYCDLDVKIGVETFALLEEAGIYYILRSDTQEISSGLDVKPAKEVRRAKSIDKQDDYYKRKFKSDANEKDKKHDKTKGKTFSLLLPKK